MIGVAAAGTTLAVRAQEIAEEGRTTATLVAGTMAADGVATTCGLPRRVISVRKTVSRIGAKTVARMPAVKSVGWIGLIRLRGNTDARGAIMPAQRRWIGPTASSGRNVYSVRNGWSVLKDRNVRSGLRGPGGISQARIIRNAQAAAPGDLPGAAMVLRWPVEEWKERIRDR